MKIGVIGANGFIGKNFYSYLLSKRIKAIIIKRPDFNIDKIKNKVSKYDAIYDFSVVWGGNKIDQIINNAFGPFLIAAHLNRKQQLIWISTSAINTDSDYGFSKKIAERALLKFQNVKIIRLSDVYGPGQIIDEKIISPQISARRIQRFIAAYKSIKKGRVDWIPAHGFSKKSGAITHQINNDFIYPTFIDDVVWKLDKVRFDRQRITEFYGPGISNFDLVKTIQKFFNLDIEIFLRKTVKLGPKLISKPELTTFSEGLEKWSIK